MRSLRRVGRCLVVAGLLSPLAGAAGAPAAEMPVPDGARSSTEIESRRTAFSREWRTDDGGRVTRISAVPERWKDPSGQWRALDTTLEPTADGGSLRAAVADATVEVPTDQHGDSPVVLRDGNAEMELRLQGAASAKGVALGQTARAYTGVLPGVQQRIGSSASGLKEELVLAGPLSPRRFSYELRLSAGLAPVVAQDGALAIRRGDQRVFSLSRVLSYEQEDPAEQHLGAPYQLQRVSSGVWIVTIDADDTWLRDPQRSWPVVVDPSITVDRVSSGAGSCIEYAHVHCTTAPHPGHNDEWRQAGWDWTGNMGWSVKVGSGPFTLPAVLAGRTVTKAELGVSLSGQVNTTGKPQRIASLGAYETPLSPGTLGVRSRQLQWRASKEVAGPGPVALDVTAEIRQWQAQDAGATYTPRRAKWLWVDILGQASKVSGPDPLPAGDACYLEDGRDMICDENRVDVATPFHPDETKRPYLDIYSTPPAQQGSEIEDPIEGKMTSRFVDLRAKATSANVTSVSFQYIAGDSREWQQIPREALRVKTTGATPASDEIPVTDGSSRRLVWDLNRTPGGQADGPVHVRAILDAGSAHGGGVTPERNFRIDRKNPETSSFEAVGPAEIDLLTGDVKVTETDASIKAFINDLTLTRTYHSRGGPPRTSDMFGPGWTSSFEIDGGAMPYRSIYNFTDVKEEQHIVEWGIDDSLVDYEYFDPFDLQFFPIYETTRFETTYAVLEKADGSKITFRKSGSDWVVDDAQPNVKVKQDGGIFTVTDADGGVTVFEPEVSGSPTYRPQSYTQPGSSKVATFQYRMYEGRLRLFRILAPALDGVTCPNASPTTSWVAGCRALELEWGTRPVDGKDMPRVLALRLRAIDPSGTEPGNSVQIATYEYDGAGRLQKVSDPRVAGGLPTEYAYDGTGRLTSYKPAGEVPWTFSYQAINGDDGAGRVRAVSRKTPHNEIATTTFVYDVPLSGAGAPNELSGAAVNAWGQTDLPWTGTAVFPPDTVPPGNGAPTSWDRATIHYLGAHGKTVNLADAEGHIATTEYDRRGNAIRELTARNRERALAASDSVAASHDLDTQRSFAANGVDVVEIYGPKQQIRLKNGNVVSGRRITRTSYDVGKPSEIGGQPFTGDQHLPTLVNSGVWVDASTPIADQQEIVHRYSDGTNHRGWQVKEPLSTTVGTGTEAVTTTFAYHASYPLLTEKRLPKGADSNATTYHYYGVGSPPSWCVSGAGLSSAAAAGGLLCAAEPKGLPVGGALVHAGRFHRYSLLWDPVQVHNGVSVSHDPEEWVRTTTIDRDKLGRETSRSIVGPGRAVPTVNTIYDAATGREQSTYTLGASGSAVSRTWDDNGRLVAYSDGSGTITNYFYDLNGRVNSVQDSRGTRRLVYDDRDLVTAVVDSTLPGPITATRDADGNVVEQILPSGPKLTQTYDPDGEAILQVWERTSGCSGSACRLASSAAERDGQGRVVRHESEDAESAYAYDTVGRLAREDTTRDACVRRDYSYDKNSNRTVLDTYLASASGACGTGSGSSTFSSYDGADKSNRSGYGYDDLGRTLTVPAAESPSGATTLTYDQDDLVASIVTADYEQTVQRDPMRRLRSDTTKTPRSGPLSAATTATLRYADDEDEPTGRSGTWGWERYVTGVDDEQLAVVTDDGHVTWQLTDLHGDVVATVESGATAAQSESAYDAFGTLAFSSGSGIASGAPGLTHGWLGGYGKHTAVSPGGFVHMGARVYNPASGRFLQVDPIEGGSANDYEYAFQDPVNNLDLDGELAFALPAAPFVGALIGSGVRAVAGQAVRAVVRQAARVPRGAGPSGKPKVHFPQHNTRKGAREAAQRAGRNAKPKNESRDKKGSPPHYHRGDKVKDGVHHRYPKRRR